MSSKYRYKQINYAELDELDRRCVDLTRWGCLLYRDDPDNFSLEAMGWRINPDLDRPEARNVARAVLSRTYSLLGRCSCEEEVFLWQLGVESHGKATETSE